MSNLLGPELVILLSHAVCNYRCRFCSQRLYNNLVQPWPMSRITKDCEPLWETAKLVNLGSVGEVGLWPYFDEAVEFFTARGVKVCFTSNGRYLNADKLRGCKLDHVMVSLHTVDEQVYDELTGTKGNLPVVMENLRILCRQPRDYQVIVTVVLTEKNVGQAVAVAQFCREIGIDQLKLTPLVEPEGAGLVAYDADLPMMENEENRRCLEEARKIMGDDEAFCRVAYTLEQRREVVVQQMPECSAPYSQTVVNYDGRVFPCCFMGGAQDDMGNIFEQPWEEIWNGKKYTQFRESLKTASNPDCLHLCRNWG
jgi:radical SAM protein with 4Fe4S-binding SPASM domain